MLTRTNQKKNAENFVECRLLVPKFAPAGAEPAGPETASPLLEWVE